MKQFESIFVYLGRIPQGVRQGRFRQWWLLPVIAFGILGGTIACQEKSMIRTYTETSTVPKRQHTTPITPSEREAKPHSIKWETPPGWVETPGSGMRLTTFHFGKDQMRGECTIVKLSGNGGGDRANIKRWIGQFNLPLPSEDALDAFIASQSRFKSAGGFDILVVDLTTLPKTTRQNPVPHRNHTMIASIVSLNGATLFAKMTGPTSTLLEHRDAFIALNRSITTADHP